MPVLSVGGVQTVLSVAVAIELHYKDPSNLPSTNTGSFVLGVENLRNSALVDLIVSAPGIRRVP